VIFAAFCAGSFRGFTGSGDNREADSGCWQQQSFDLCPMLESYDFDNLFLFFDPVINQIIPMDEF